MVLLEAGSSDVTDAGARRRELTVVATALTILIATLALSGARVLFTRPLWMDELVTMFIVSQPDARAMIDLIAKGGDWNPPLLHLILRTLAPLGFDTPTLFLRTFAVVCVALALLFVYAALRRRLSAQASIAGLVAVAANPVVLQQAFDARFYAPWLLFAAATCWALGIDTHRERSMRRDFATAIAAMLLCTIHWFGVFSLGLIQLGALIVHRRRFRHAVRLLAPTLAGLVALGVVAPLAISQRASATGVLWVLPLSWAQVKAMAALYWTATIPLAALTVLAVVLAGRRWLGPSSPLNPPPPLDNPLAALLALAGMPAALVAISIVLQPSMVDRYGTVAALAWAPLAAVAVEALGARLGAVALLALSVMFINAGRRAIAERANYAQQIGGYAESFTEAMSQGAPVVFLRLHTIFPVDGPNWRSPSPARFLVLPDSSINALYPSPKLGWLRRQFEVEREVVLYNNSLHGFPRVITRADLDTTSRFVLLAGDLNLPGGYKQVERWGQAVLPRHHVTRITDVLSVFELPKDSPSARSRTVAGASPR